MNVFEPLSRYSSPSRRAVDFIEPKASEPELGSVIAQAPIFSSVSSSGTQRSFWAIVPLRHDRGRGQAHRHAHGGDHARAVPAQLDDRDQRERWSAAAARRSASSAAPRPARPLDRLLDLDALLEAARGHGVHAEGREQLAEDVVGRRVAVLELLDVRLDLLLHELADGVADHQLLVGPLVHGSPPSSRGKHRRGRARPAPNLAPDLAEPPVGGYPRAVDPRHYNAPDVSPGVPTERGNALTERHEWPTGSEACPR